MAWTRRHGGHNQGELVDQSLSDETAGEADPLGRSSSFYRLRTMWVAWSVA
jgi:hypothetical protein